MKNNTVTLDYGCPMCQQHTPSNGFAVLPITIQRNQDGPMDFKCTHCGSSGHYQFAYWGNTEHIQWSFENWLSFRYVYDCPHCGSKLTEYVTLDKYNDNSVCRHCGRERSGSLTGYR